jgi:SAM-dependent methyltransferase
MTPRDHASRRAGPLAPGGPPPPAVAEASSGAVPLNAPPARAAAVIWHEVECGGYEADLGLWEELASEADEPLLELGCGTGRVSLYLARRGHLVAGVDSDAALVAAFSQRADELPATALVADARGFELDRAFGLVLAPMQLVQLLGNEAERIACLSCAASHLLPGGVVAVAIVEDLPAPVDAPAPLPDVREADGWVHSSLPLETVVGAGEIVVRRLRQTVAPSGLLTDEVSEVRLQALSAAELEAEAERAGLRPLGRRAIPPTEAHVGSTAVLLEGRA